MSKVTLVVRVYCLKNRVIWHAFGESWGGTRGRQSACVFNWAHLVLRSRQNKVLHG